MNTRFWFQSPGLIVPRLRYWLWQKSNPQAPWFSSGAVEYCDTVLSRSMRVLEFGSGRSTVWFGRRVGHLTSIEHSQEWFERVRHDLHALAVNNVDCLLIPLDHDETEPEQDQYDPMPAYVDVLKRFDDNSLDMIIVDGHYRTTCIRRCPEKLRAGGLLLVDDTNWLGGSERAPVPKSWQVVHESGNGLKTTTIWKKPIATRQVLR
jgi:predicted O-methyltransferase YrrM